MHLTVKQIELLSVIAKGEGPGLPSDLDQILDKVSYETSKQSIQFSIRALIARGLIYKRGVEKRRGRQRQVIASTTLGDSVCGTNLGAAVSPSYVETDLDSVVEFNE